MPEYSKIIYGKTSVIFSFWVIPVLLLIIACTKGKEEVTLRTQELEISWIMGAEHTLDTTITLDSVADLSIWVKEFSLCPSHQVKVVVSNNDEIIKQQSFDDNSDTLEVEITVSNPISIRTVILPAENQINCIWLGQAHFNLSY